MTDKITFTAINAPEDDVLLFRLGFRSPVTLAEQCRKYSASLPAEINGFPVVASIRLPDAPGMLPMAHVVVCRQKTRDGFDDAGDNHAHVVWFVAWHETQGWTAHHGHYDMPRDRALRLMLEKALGE